MLVRSTAVRGLLVRMLLAGIVVGGAVAVGLLIAQPLRPVAVHVRWASALDDGARVRLAASLGLADGTPAAERTWRYVLARPTTAAIAAIVRHPQVEDTEHLNRRWFRPEFGQDAGRQALVFGALAAVLASMRVLLGWLLRDPDADAGSLASTAGTRASST